MVWSNRGPGATGERGRRRRRRRRVLGRRRTLNTVLDGRDAWTTWGGTSRSTPVAAGAAALVYQAYRQANGGAAPGRLLRDRQGHPQVVRRGPRLRRRGSRAPGSVDAGDAVDTALGDRARVSPNEWRVGDYRGTEYPVFAHVIAPGRSDTQTFTSTARDLEGVRPADGPHGHRDARRSRARTSRKESAYNFNAPDYLMDISSAWSRSTRTPTSWSCG